jgi:hypothetical protein
MKRRKGEREGVHRERERAGRWRRKDKNKKE